MKKYLEVVRYVQIQFEPHKIRLCQPFSSMDVVPHTDTPSSNRNRRELKDETFFLFIVVTTATDADTSASETSIHQSETYSHFSMNFTPCFFINAGRFEQLLIKRR